MKFACAAGRVNQALVHQGRWKLANDFRFELQDDPCELSGLSLAEALLEEHIMRMHNPPHPGRIIKEAIEAIPMTVTAFAAHISVSRVALSRVLNERAGVTPEMSIRISEAFGQDSPDIWFNMRNDHDFWQASKAKTHRTKIKPLETSAA